MVEPPYISTFSGLSTTLLYLASTSPAAGFRFDDMSPVIDSDFSFTRKIIEPPPSHTDAFPSLTSSSILLIDGRNVCGAALSTPACTRRLHVRGGIIWWKITAYDEHLKRRYDRPFQIHRTSDGASCVSFSGSDGARLRRLLLGIRRRLLCLLGIQGHFMCLHVGIRRCFSCLSLEIRWCLPCLFLGIRWRFPCLLPEIRRRLLCFLFVPL